MEVLAFNRITKKVRILNPFIDSGERFRHGAIEGCAATEGSPLCICKGWADDVRSFNRSINIKVKEWRLS